MWSKVLFKSKSKAAFVHVGLSLVVFLVLLYLICFRWFPGPMFFSDGGWQGTKIMLLVDVVLGPSLTFLVFNPAKSRRQLSFDLGLIGLVQGAALSFGIYAVEQSSIWSVAFSEGAFTPIRKNLYNDQTIPEHGWAALGNGPQYWVYVREPQGEEQAGVFMAAFVNSVPAEALYFLYDRLDLHQEEVRKQALDMPGLAAGDPDLRRRYERFEQEHQALAGKLSYYRLNGYYGTAIVALDAQLRYVGYLAHDFTPSPGGSSPETPARH